MAAVVPWLGLAVSLLGRPLLRPPRNHGCCGFGKGIIANNLSKAGWSLGYVSALDSQGRTIWIADAHRGDRKRFVVHADKMLTAFVELQRAIHAFAVSLIS
jgi:hypothetical protein